MFFSRKISQRKMREKRRKIFKIFNKSFKCFYQSISSPYKGSTLRNKFHLLSRFEYDTKV